MVGDDEVDQIIPSISGKEHHWFVDKDAIVHKYKQGAAFLIVVNDYKKQSENGQPAEKYSLMYQE